MLDQTAAACCKLSSPQNGGDEHLNDLCCRRGVGVDLLKRIKPFQTCCWPQEKGKFGKYIAACSELVYSPKHSVIRVGSDVKQS